MEGSTKHLYREATAVLTLTLTQWPDGSQCWLCKESWALSPNPHPNANLHSHAQPGLSGLNLYRVCTMMGGRRRGGGGGGAALRSGAYVHLYDVNGAWWGRVHVSRVVVLNSTPHRPRTAPLNMREPQVYQRCADSVPTA